MGDKLPGIEEKICYHIQYGDFTFDTSDPESRCSLCGALCKDIFHVGIYEDRVGSSIKSTKYIKEEKS